LYCRTPFGRLHHRNKEIISISERISRTPSAVAMKAVNFASLDPAQQARKISGLRNVSRSDRRLWEEFLANSAGVASEAEEAYAQRLSAEELAVSATEVPEGPTEIERTVRSRRVQAFFRAAVLASYEYRCAISGLDVPGLLNASHIIPWSQDEKRRADPRNGIALNALHDRAFDRGLITFDKDLRIVVSPLLQVAAPGAFHRSALLRIHGRALALPKRFAPDPGAISYHREHIFRSA